MSLVFVRHGQTALNRSGLLQGRVDAPLTDVGREQAGRLGEALSAEVVTRVVSSPLGRAVDTAAAIAARHGLSVETDERLLEIDYGAWDERPVGDVGSGEWAAWFDDPGFRPPGGESLRDVQARVSAFCEDVIASDGVVVAVTHVSPIKAAVVWSLGVDERVIWRLYVGLASITRVGRREGTGLTYLTSFNEVAHL